MVDRVVSPLLAVLAACSCLATAFAAPTFQLSFQSDPGDGIGQGQSANYLYTAANSNLSGGVLLTVGASPARPAYLRFYGVAKDPRDPNRVPTFLLDLSTDQLMMPFAVGTYTNAERAAFATPGHPGLDFGFDGRSCNTIAGNFTVNAFTYTYDGQGNPVVVKLDASIEQHCEGATARLVGQFIYDANFDVLQVARSGTGSGRVTSSPAGIDCGGACSATFAPGESVTLTATAASGSTFTGWGGECAGIGQCAVVMNAPRNVTATFTRVAPAPGLVNLSTRGAVGTVDAVLIGGFIIQADEPQTVIVRARGPSLGPLGVPSPLADPVLQLFAGQAIIAYNDDWQSSPDAANIQARGFAPADPREAAILITLAPGAYTAIMSGKGGGTGIGIVEVFSQ